MICTVLMSKISNNLDYSSEVLEIVDEKTMPLDGARFGKEVSNVLASSENLEGRFSEV